MSDYTEQANRHNQALQAYRLIYEELNPPPQRVIASKDNRVMLGVLLIIVIASVVVSASHSVPLFMQGTGAAVGVSAFIMLELGLVTLKYLNTRNKATIGKAAGDSSKWIAAAVWLVFVILLTANVYYVTKEHGFQHPAVDFAVVILIGVSAPSLALVCGEALALESVKTQLEQRALDKEYAAQLIDYQDAFKVSWNARKSRYVRVESEPVQPVQPLKLTEKTDKQPRISPKTETALSWLKEHPEHWKTPSRELVEQIGVSHVTIYNAQQQLLLKGD